jgi:hypothetical protein
MISCSTSRPWSAVATGLLLASCAVAVALGLTPFYKPSYRPEIMSTIPTEHQSSCMGRYQIDVPKGFHQVSGGWGNIELYYGLDKNFERVYASVDSSFFTREQFLARVKLRQAELNETINAATKSPMLLHAEKVNETTYLLRRMGNQFYNIAIQTEVHQLVGDRYVHYQLTSYDHKASFGHKSTRNIDPEPSESRLKMIAGKLKTEEQGGPGFCFQGVSFDVGQDDEVASFIFLSDTVPDLALRIYYHAVTGQPKETLFERRVGAALQAPHLAARILTIRKRDLLVGGMQAQEVLDKTQVVQQIFDAETHTDKQGIARPLISISMTTGRSVMRADKEVQKKGPSSLSDDQAIGLWDGIIKSIRLRPISLPPGMTALGDTIPLCRFGDVCPRSGYWMKQVTHSSFAFNGYHALPRVHQPFKEGVIFLPDIEDEERFRPFTTWAWRRELG